MKRLLILGSFLCLFCYSCQHDGAKEQLNLIILEPGHFHASLILKADNDNIGKKVYVYAPAGEELNAFLNLVESYNTRKESPTCWEPVVYTKPDYLTRMREDKQGNVVVLAGNNRYKIRNICYSIESGYHVLSDKPMIINEESFAQLEWAYRAAEKQGLILYDMMTERYDDLNIIQRALMQDTLLFGRLQKGSPDQPAVESESVHHFIKEVSGAPLLRPTWYYDVEQQGDGITDVTTHLIDQVMWKCFPEQAIDYRKDVRVKSASRWATKFSIADFQRSTGVSTFPDFLQKDVANDTLSVFANGRMQFEIRGVQVAVQVEWNKQAPEGSGDQQKFVVRGTHATLSILQGAPQNFQPQLYVRQESDSPLSESVFEKALQQAVRRLSAQYSGITFHKTDDGAYEIDLPSALKSNHESHFQKVVEHFITYVRAGRQPQWEVTNTISKYYITTQSLKLAKSGTQAKK